MKTFETVKAKMAVWNFFSNQPPILNPTFQRCCMISITSITSHIVFLFHVATTDEEYMNSIYMTIAGFAVLTSYVNTSYNVPNLKVFFEKADETINESK